jgi:hypothetical protein
MSKNIDVKCKHALQVLIDLATATVHRKLTVNVPTMESAEKCVWFTKRLAKYVKIPTLDKHNKN